MDAISLFSFFLLDSLRSFGISFIGQLLFFVGIHFYYFVFIISFFIISFFIISFIVLYLFAKDICLFQLGIVNYIYHLLLIVIIKTAFEKVFENV